MLVSEKIDSLINGAIDMHIHSGPGLIPRSVDHVQAARDAIAAGLRGIVVKDQHSMTCHMVAIIKKYILDDPTFDIFGGVVLNNAAGGLSPHVVDGAIKSGAKIIWMPTASSENHIEVHKRDHDTKFPNSKQKLLEEIPLKIIDEQGDLLPVIPPICELIGDARVILGTGHLYLEETQKLIDKAIDCGVKKIVMQHPEYLIEASIDEMVAIADKGVFIEHSMVFYVTDMIEREYLKEMIRAVGAERTIIASDLGQTYNPVPMEGFRKCIEVMLDLGIRDEEIDLMIKKNPAKLLDLN